jgi:hypothetical protein
MDGVKSTNLEYSGVLMIAFGVIGLFQAFSAIMTRTPLNLLPLFIGANVIEVACGVALLKNRRIINLGILANLLLLAARVLAASGRSIGVLEVGFWLFIGAVAFSLFREGRRGESADGESLNH